MKRHQQSSKQSIARRGLIRIGLSFMYMQMPVHRTPMKATLVHDFQRRRAQTNASALQSLSVVNGLTGPLISAAPLLR